MFDGELDKIYETYKRVLNETKEDISIRMTRLCVELIVFDDEKVKGIYTAYFYEDMRDVTEEAIKHILDVLTHMLEGGVVGV